MANITRAAKLKTLGWKLPFALGIVAMLGIWGGWRILNPPLSAEDIVHLRVGYDLHAIRELVQLQNKVENTHNLSPEEWRRLKTIFTDRSINSKTRRYALATMMGLGKTTYRNEILSLAKPELQNPDWVWQNGALILLRHFDDPAWRSEAAKRLNHSDENIRSNAAVQVTLGNAPKRKRSPRP